MESPSVMNIGHQVLRDLSLRFTQIEGQFNLLRWIDSQLSESDLEIDIYLETLTERLQQLMNARKSGTFTYWDNVLIDYSQRCNQSAGHLLAGEMSLDRMPQGHATFATEENAQAGYCRLYIKIAPRKTPEIILAFEDAFFGRKLAPFYDEGLLTTAQMAAVRSEVLIDSHHSRAEREQTEKLTKQFLFAKAPLHEGAERNGSGDLERYFDKRWVAIVELFAGYFPTRAPFAFATQPKVQILTVDSSQFIILRATHGEYNVAYKPLNRDKTICGLLLEREARQGPQEYLYVNPRDPKHEDRYASFLYDEIPQSELVIPVRNLQNEIIALINLEHPDPNAFSDYHRQLALSATNLVATFILYLFWEEAEAISAQKLFRYVIVRLIKRLSDTYLHKIVNQIPIIKGSLKVLEKQKERIFSADQLQDFEDIRAGVYELSNLSTSFLANLAGYISFGKVHLGDVIAHSIDDFDVEKIEKTENIQITIDNISSDVIVFGSELIREHIYNIVKNSLDQLRIKHREGQPRKGLVNISTSREKEADLRGKQASYELVRVSIRDNGGGILKGYEDKVLQPGVTTKKDIGGTGYGLSAAAEYMIGIGGYLKLDNEPGVGLTVNLYLPVYTEGYHEVLSRKLNVLMEGERSDEREGSGIGR